MSEQIPLVRNKTFTAWLCIIGVIGFIVLLGVGVNYWGDQKIVKIVWYIVWFIVFPALLILSYKYAVKGINEKKKDKKAEN